MLKAWLELARISNLPTIWTNVLAAWVVAYGGFQYAQLAALMVGGSLVYTAGMILNDAADVGFDRTYRPERPIPSGRVSAKTAWMVGMALLLGGAVVLLMGGRANVWLVAALIAAIVAYDLYHKPWAGSVVIMGACRTLLYLVAGYAATGGRRFVNGGGTGEAAGWRMSQDGQFCLPALSWGSFESLIVHALVIGCYIVGLTLVARQESRRTGASSGWALWFARGLLYSPGILAAGWIAFGGPLLNVALVAAFAGMVALAMRRMRWGGPGVGDAVGLLLAGIVIVDALAIASVDPYLGLVCAVGAPALRLWQRKIAAT